MVSKARSTQMVLFVEDVSVEKWWGKSLLDIL